jgi:copper chaperone NosL
MMRTAIGAVCAAMIGCAAGPPAPVAVRLGEDACAHCRMTIVSMATAAQIVSAGAEPIVFDELGCMREYLREHTPGAGATIFVADHRTAEWVDASEAIFTQTSQHTPMASGLLAHANLSSRDADPAAQGGTWKALPEVLEVGAGSARK